MSRHVVKLLKIVIPAAIVVWLLVDVQRNDPQTFAELAQRPKDWPMLAAAWGVAMLAVCITFVRWHLLVRALEMPFRLRDAFRLSFLGYLLNFVSLGNVGGDLFKAIFIARQMPNRRAEAIATVVVDRVIGLYALLVVATTAILLTDLSRARPEVVAICRATHMGTAAGGVAILLMLVPGFTHGRLSQWAAALPKIGPTLGQLIAAVRVYRRKLGVLGAISLMSFAVHGLFAVSFYLMARSLFDKAPSLAEHFIIIPLAMVAGALPVAPNGLGAFEYVADFLYEHLPAAGGINGQGLVVALTYRVMTIVIALVGVCYYWTSRREVSEVLEKEMQNEE